MPGDEDDSKDEDEKSDEKADDEKKDEDHKEDEEEEDDDAGADKDGALGKKKKPPDSMMVQRKSVSRSGAAGIAAQQIAEGADQMQMAMTVVGLVIFVLIIIGVGGFVLWKVFFSSSDAVDLPPIEDATTENISGGVPFHEMPGGDFWDDSSGKPPVSIVFAEDTESVEENVQGEPRNISGLDDPSAVALDYV
ncbi:uncharacterized protein LOC119432553 [Dermacentor silvarum]|uniref:uncharacterized protein LOC119432553 n=1 Tax=Dermacentor silvarum TaxID=543639 RepID=UPI00189ACC41|nr:uncharacterized protein LOC119432553 [Dermacentor silvarum]